jgi:hypothetical protein
LRQFDEELWAIDVDLFDLLEDELIQPEDIEGYVESHLENYLASFRENELYVKHVVIIEQAYDAFKFGQYALASFPLLAAIDFLMESKFAHFEEENKVKYKPRARENKLDYKLKKYVSSTEDELAITILFFRRVYFVFNSIFQPAWGSHPEHINRHWVMHGSYSYSEIGKTEALKLFQLLRAQEVLNRIEFESDN